MEKSEIDEKLYFVCHLTMKEFLEAEKLVDGTETTVIEVMLDAPWEHQAIDRREQFKTRNYGPGYWDEWDTQ